MFSLPVEPTLTPARIWRASSAGAVTQSGPAGLRPDGATRLTIPPGRSIENRGASAAFLTMIHAPRSIDHALSHRLAAISGSQSELTLLEIAL